jgi:hypothetical protein
MLIENARLSKLKTTFFSGGCCFCEVALLRTDLMRWAALSEVEV